MSFFFAIQFVKLGLEGGGWGCVILGLGLAGNAIWRLAGKTAVVKWRVRRTRLASKQEIADGWDGSRRRLVGVVETAETPAFVAPGRNVPAVFCETLFSPDTFDGGVDRDTPLKVDARGIPFRIRLADGTSIKVDPITLMHLNKPKPLPAPSQELREALGAVTKSLLPTRRKIRQQCICPGDTVEVVGRLEIVVSAKGEAAPGRGTPMERRLVGVGDEEVLIRVLQPSSSSADD